MVGADNLGSEDEAVHICRKCAYLSYQRNQPLFCASCEAQIASCRPNKSYTIPSTTHTYAYIHYPPFPFQEGREKEKPTLLFLHGFPSTSYEWRHQLKFFIERGYGVLAPDLLGSGNTSKPLDVNSYVGRSMASSIISILDHEKLCVPGKEVIAIAHDWGTYLLSQLIVWHDDRFTKYVFFSVPHTLPGRRTDLEAFNKVMKEKKGYEIYGYQFFLAEVERAGTVLGKNWESFFNMIYPSDPALWKIHMAPRGAMESFLSTHSPADSAVYSAGWVNGEDKKRHHEAFGDSYEPVLNWYKRGKESLGVDYEKEALTRGEIANGGRIKKETLMLTGQKDAVCSADRARGVMGSVVKKGLLKVVDLDAGHWIMHEQKDETNRVLEDFFDNGVSGAAAGDRGLNESKL